MYVKNMLGISISFMPKILMLGIVLLSCPTGKPYATVNEGAKEGSVVAIVSVTDKDDGINGQTTVQIIKGNEYNHFDLTSG